MTTLAVVKKKGVVAIAADSGETLGSCLLPAEYVEQPSKIVKVGRSFVAICGSAAHGRVIASLARRHRSAFKLDLNVKWRSNGRTSSQENASQETSSVGSKRSQRYLITPVPAVFQSHSNSSKLTLLESSQDQ